MALSAQAVQQVLDWIRGGQQGPPPAAATAAATGPGTSTVPMGGVTAASAATSPDTGPSPEAAPSPARALPYPNPQTLKERQYNTLQQLQWQLEDANAALEAARADPDRSWQLNDLAGAAQRLVVAVANQQDNIRQTEASERSTGAARTPHTIQKQERGPDGETYVVTYTVDAQGNETWNGEKPVKLDLGASPTAGLELQTAQLNLQRAQQQLAAEQDPLKRQQLQLQVQTAQQQLEQARARAPLDLRLQELNVQQAEANLNRPSVQTVGGRAVGINPLTGERTFTTDLLSPDERAAADERAGLDLEAARRGTLPQNAYAAYTQERSRLQEAGRAEIDRLQELQRQGVLSAAQAQSQWQQWMGPRQAQLQGLEAAAREAQRAEQQRTDELQRAENARVEALNRQREQLGLEVGERARSELASILPQVRTPEVLAGLGQSVANMSARAAAPSAEAAAALPRTQAFTPGMFDPAKFRAIMPNLDEFARQATERALASISPTVAQRIGVTLPPLPSGDALTGLLNAVPYAGPLARAPAGVQPLPGQAAIDLGTGQARTVYPGGGFLDWPIAAGGA